MNSKNLILTVFLCFCISSFLTAQFVGTNPSILSDNGLVTQKFAIAPSTFTNFTNARLLTLQRSFSGLPAAGAPLIDYTTGLRFSHIYAPFGTTYTTYNWDIAVMHNKMYYHFLNTNTTIMTLQSDGKVGVATKAPDATLHVKNFNSTSLDAHLEGFTLLDGNQASLLLGAETGASYGEWGIEYNPGAKGLNFWRPAGHQEPITTGADPNYMLFIHNGGKVSIGLDPTVSSTFNGDYKLYVGRGILTEKVKVALVNTTDWADYVFDKNYQLMPLTEVEKYVNKNHHLPGVPSAEDVKKEGIDVAKMDAKLLEKIEELTLYVIELEKKYDNLKKELEATKK